MRKTFLIISVITALVFPIAFALAVDSAPRALEIEYPSIPNGTAPSGTTDLPKYVEYLFQFAIAGSGLVALVVITLAGIQYLSSTGMPNKISDAKDRIMSALFGLAILFCSWLILNTINPAFLKFSGPEIDYANPPSISSGVYVCKTENNSIQEFWGLKKQVEGQDKPDKQTVARMVDLVSDINKNCSLRQTKGGVPNELAGKIKTVWLVPNSKDKVQYGVIVYKDATKSANGKVFFGSGGESPSIYAMDQPTSLSVSANGLGDIGYLEPFILNFSPASSWYAKVFEEINNNTGTGTQQKKSQNCQITQASQNCQVLPEMRSIQLNGNIFAIFKKSGGYASWSVSDEIDIVESSSKNLYGRLMAEWNKQKCQKDVGATDEKGNKLPDYYPCAESLIVVSGDFL